MTLFQMSKSLTQSDMYDIAGRHALLRSINAGAWWEGKPKVSAV